MLKNVINRHRTALMRQCSVMLVEGRLPPEGYSSWTAAVLDIMPCLPTDNLLDPNYREVFAQAGIREVSKPDDSYDPDEIAGSVADELGIQEPAPRQRLQQQQQQQQQQRAQPQPQQQSQQLLNPLAALRQGAAQLGGQVLAGAGTSAVYGNHMALLQMQQQHQQLQQLQQQRLLQQQQQQQQMLLAQHLQQQPPLQHNT
jgi:hypothetical protein